METEGLLYYMAMGIPAAGTGADRAAKLLLLLGSDTAVPVISRLGDETAEMLARAIARTDCVGLSESVVILADFLGETGNPVKNRTGPCGGPKTAARLLASAFGPEKAGSIMQRALCEN